MRLSKGVAQGLWREAKLVGKNMAHVSLVVKTRLNRSRAKLCALGTALGHFKRSQTTDVLAHGSVSKTFEGPRKVDRIDRDFRGNLRKAQLCPFAVVNQPNSLLKPPRLSGIGLIDIHHFREQLNRHPFALLSVQERVNKA